MPIYVNSKYSLRIWLKSQEHDLPGKLIISLTSYPPRFRTLHLTIKSLLVQRVRPDIIELWVAENDYPMLPCDVTKLMKDGLVIRQCKDLRSYKKIIPRLQFSQCDWVVIADDDLYYWSTWLKELTDAVNPDRLEVICSRCHRIKFEHKFIPAPYISWDFDVLSPSGNDVIFPTGVGGVLYPPGSFYKDVCNHNLFMRLCPTGDDIWLFWMAAINGATFRRSAARHRQIVWAGSQECALFKQNAVFDNQNDRQISAMMKEYGWPIAVAAITVDSQTTRGLVSGA
ncbi:glycosyltransferase family 2 protein [Paraburkholderia pallida]|uniref:Glycosyltransferase family 2 protein n=1 Tax=Paraburkholderia pallida TaxID=2547399 RepID=A0A4P7CSE8_9BURK|nr:glycosyltransferase family 2 protein [Paraburkholderia pallida]QBQ96703.1 glycosyltransferase family 2 protein [Paraburkholderia pallida]